MPSPRIVVLRAPGTNCDQETAYAFERVGGIVEALHIARVLESPSLLENAQILCIPGGFSYGDDLGAGVIFSRTLSGPLADVLAQFTSRSNLLLGICNGFQVLLKAGLLPGGSAEEPAAEARPVTLTWNLNGQYTARWVRLKTMAPHNVFLRGIEEIELPIAHAEGRLALRDPSRLAAWKQQGQIALCYIPRDSSRGDQTVADPTAVPLEFPDNPNGSVGNVAGLSDATGRILGLMPHPERFQDALQHPRWTRRPPAESEPDGEGAGLRMFRNAVEYFR